MRAKRPKIPTPGPLSSALTTAACVASAGDAMGVVQVELAGALYVAALVLDEGEGVAAGDATAGATGTATTPAAGAAGPGTGAPGPGPLTAAGAGAAGFGLAGTGAGAGAGAGAGTRVGAGSGTGADAGAVGDVVGAGAGVLGAGETGEGEAWQFSGRQVVACTGPPAPTKAASASTEAASPGSTSVRRLVGRIMCLPLLGAQGSPAPGFIPGIFLYASADHQIPYCRFSGCCGSGRVFSSSLLAAVLCAVVERTCPFRTFRASTTITVMLSRPPPRSAA